MNERYICIHGHFYQPPRENPWLEAIEVQDSAYPYHDWNERIASECYATNAAARILDPQGRIERIVNNYAKISFNFGPTLLAWLEQKAPDVYRAILQADRESQERFSGHGSALAQAYNHMILPLANRRDKYTQIVWAIRDFESGFGRAPEGMWLPETAVDLETLDILAELGIRFTVLAPRQAARVKAVGAAEWHDVSGEKIDPSTAYTLRLPSDRSISLFFYDGPISRAVAFEGILGNGEGFAQRLLGGFSEARNWPQLVHIATDGESYGHHYRRGDMALAYALHYIESHGLARLTNYGEYLEKHPPANEVQIFENSSWSCIHGVERWRGNCGCNSGGYPQWNQNWRAPLRQALDWLRDVFAPAYAHRARLYLRDPWGARNAYFPVVRHRSGESLDAFLKQEALRTLNETEKITVLKLLELQRHAMLMYTSCGWFFDEVSGLEAAQVLQYAGRALQLGRELFGDAVAYRFFELLEEVKSNLPEHRDGRLIFEAFVHPAALDLEKVAAHYAVRSLFEGYGEEARISCYTIKREDHQTAERETARLLVGRITVTSNITRESSMLDCYVLHLGHHNLKAGVGKSRDKNTYHRFTEQALQAFKRGESAGTMEILDGYFGESTYSLRSLFRDEQRRILDTIQEASLADVEEIYRQIYEKNEPFLRFLKDLGQPPPKVLATPAEFILNLRLRRRLEEENLDVEGIGKVLEEVRSVGVALDVISLEIAIRRRIESSAARLLADHARLSLLADLEKALEVTKSLPFEVELRKVQDICYGMLHTVLPKMQQEARGAGKEAKEWVDRFVSLCERLSINVGGPDASPEGNL
jgi:alpha-amylase/alpha-mannosidase (GH57 family)